MQRVADEHDVAAAPTPVLHEQEVNPPRVVRHQLVPAEVSREDFAEVAARLLVRPLVQSCARPRLLIALDDEGARRGAELVRVRGEDARVRLAEGECESVEELARAVPDVLVAPRVERRLKCFRVALAHKAPHAVRADEQVAVGGERAGVLDS